ncbi:hypothetical protein [Paraburkholderia flava]|uniref:hypothetical protein n=1 Tax=Paraburkholderia flava TaxID=2547393 RepID=UPI00105D7A10|nr:hypothetical protein [Paraburkholderia flava]
MPSIFTSLRRTAAPDDANRTNDAPSSGSAPKAPGSNSSATQANQNVAFAGLKTVKQSSNNESGKFAALRANFKGRQTTVGTRILGIGKSRSNDMPSNALLPQQSVESDLSDDPHSDSLKQAHELTERVKSILDTTLEELPGTNERPQRSAAMRALLVIPGMGHVLKPKTARELMAGDPAYKTASKKTAQTKGDRDVDAGKIEGNQTKMLGQLATHSAAAEDAIRNVQTAQRELDEAKQAAQGATGAQPQEGAAPANPATAADTVKTKEAQLEDAHKTLKGAVDDLRASASICSMLDVGVHVLSTDLVNQKIRFVDTQIAQLRSDLGKDNTDVGQIIGNLVSTKNGIAEKQLLTAANLESAQTLHTNATALVAQLEARLQKAQQNRGVPLSNATQAVGATDDALDALTQLEARMQAGHTVSPDEVAHARSLFNSAGQQLDSAGQRLQKQRGRDSVPALSNHAKSLARELDAVKAALKDAGEDLEQCREAAEDATRALTEFTPYIDQEIDRLGKLQTKLNTAANGLDSPAQAIGDKLTASTAQLEKNRELEKQLSTIGTQAIASTAPGFDPEHLATPAGASLVKKLQTLAEALPEDDVSGERVLPRAAAMEMISRSLAVVTGSDAQAADRLLGELTSHPLNHWIAPPATGGTDGTDGASAVEHTAPSAHMAELSQLMAQIPRGIEVLNLASTPPDGKPLERGQVEATQAYWMAHAARSAETDDNVKTWLGNAMNVASHVVRNTKEETVFDTAALPLKNQAAFNAVRNGFLSNAKGSDYDLSNQNLLNVTTTIGENNNTGLLPTSFHPAKAATLFDPKTLSFAQKQMEAQGMDTTKTRAEASIMTAFEQLGKEARVHFNQLPAARRPDPRNAATPSLPPSAQDRADDKDRLFAATLVALSDYVGQEKRSPTIISRLTTPISAPSFNHTKRIYDANLGPAEKTKIRQAVHALLYPPRPAIGSRKLTKPNPSAVAPLPPAIEALFNQERVPVTDLLKTLETELSTSSDGTKAAMASSMTILSENFAAPAAGAAGADGAAGTPKIDEQVRLAKMKRFESKDDVEAFFRPMLETLRLRDQVTVTSGGTLGAGIPLLPAVPKFPMSASFGLYAEKNERFIQFKNPTFASEIMVGSTVSRLHDAKVTVGHRLEVGIATVTAPSGSAKFEASRPKTIYTSLRTLRGKDDMGVRKEQEAIDANLKLLDIMLRWDTDQTKFAEDGQPFADPLEAIFALSPDTLVASGEKQGQTNQGSFDVSAVARARTPGHHLSVGASVTPFSLKIERTAEQGTERTGYAHQTVHDRSSQARQRINASANIGVIGTPYKQAIGDIGADGKGTGQAHINLTGNLIEISREIVSNFEKNGATRFPIGDLTGHAVDRTYGTPKDLLVEVQTYREDWLQRCMDTLPRAKTDEVDTPERRAIAADILSKFEADLRRAGSNSSLQFNIKYEMQPRMSGVIDGLRGAEALALKQGDAKAATDARNMMNTILSYRASWSVKNTTVRSKGKTSEDMGLDFFLRWQKTYSSESSRARVAFPPS